MNAIREKIPLIINQFHGFAYVEVASFLAMTRGRVSVLLGVEHGFAEADGLYLPTNNNFYVFF
jgi:hypothetical protein